jgi:hypothetical protein
MKGRAESGPEHTQRAVRHSQDHDEGGHVNAEHATHQRRLTNRVAALDRVAADRTRRQGGRSAGRRPPRWT